MKFNPEQYILRPRITEKAATVSEVSNVYVFEVSKDSTKTTILRAINEIYKVKPLKVNIVKSPAKKVFTKGKKGTTASLKKAYVYLKKEDKIDIS